MVETVSKTRSERTEALDEWAEQVEPADLKIADTDALRVIGELAERKSEIDDELTAAVRAARRANRSWSEIGAMLGVSKQAAQRKYASKAS
jgi:hypothetical protein